MKKPAILLHQDELKDMAVDIMSINDLIEPIQTAHRDDHYMFIIQQDGYFLWELDFANITLSGPSICFVAPGQVHRHLKFNKCVGWLVFVNPSSIPNAHREMFDSYLNVNQSTSVQQDDAVFQIVALLLKILDQKSLPLQKALLTSLVETLTGLIISHIVQLQNSTHLMSGQKYHTFVRFKQQITRFGIRTMIKRYASKITEQFPSIEKKHISTHTIRHTTATHLLQAGADINTIRAWLGHISINTTNIYAEVDLEMKARALACCEIIDNKKQTHWRDNKDLMSFLDSI